MARRGEGIRQRPNGSWEYRWTDGVNPSTGKYIRRSVYAKTYTEILEKKRRIVAEMETTGRVLNPATTSLESWLYEWLDVYCNHLKATTVQLYRGYVNTRIVPALGAARLKDLHHSDIQKFVNELSEEVEPKTVSNYVGTLHKALRKAQELGYIRENPCDNISVPKRSKTEINTLPKSGLKTFFRYLQGDTCESFIKLCLFTGLRQSEAMGLSWDNVDLDSGVLVVKQQLHLINGKGYKLDTPKHGKTRTVPLTPQAVEVLKEQKDRQAQWEHNSFGHFDNPLNLVFTDELGNHLATNTIRKHFKRIAAEAGFPELRFHDLRHTFAVYSIQAGIDLKSISETLGHHSVAFTMDRYGHFTEEMQKTSAERLGRFISDLL